MTDLEIECLEDEIEHLRDQLESIQRTNEQLTARIATLEERALKASAMPERAALEDADRLLELAGYEVLPGNARDKIRIALTRKHA